VRRGLDVAGGAAEGVGGLLHGEVVPVAQDDDGALRGAEGGERAAQVVAVVAGARGIGVRRLREVLGRALAPPAATASDR
jgi:hypothetical protein